MVLFVFTVIYPMTPLITAPCFVFMGSMFRNQFMYIYSKNPDSGGELWAFYIQVMLSCMLIAEITSRSDALLWTPIFKRCALNFACSFSLWLARAQEGSEATSHVFAASGKTDRRSRKDVVLFSSNALCRRSLPYFLTYTFAKYTSEWLRICPLEIASRKIRNMTKAPISLLSVVSTSNLLWQHRKSSFQILPCASSLTFGKRFLLRKHPLMKN